VSVFPLSYSSLTPPPPPPPIHPRKSCAERAITNRYPSVRVGQSRVGTCRTSRTILTEGGAIRKSSGLFFESILQCKCQRGILVAIAAERESMLVLMVVVVGNKGKGNAAQWVPLSKMKKKGPSLQQRQQGNALLFFPCRIRFASLPCPIDC
jgi:hypothetical protein